MNFSKRILSLLLALILMAGCLPVTASAAGKEIYGIGFITVDGQRLYAKAASSAKVLDVTHENDCVLVIGEKNSMWYEVIYNGQTGFMYAGCLDIRTEADVELGYGAINASNTANLRTGPGLKYTQLQSGRRNDEYYIVGIRDSWFKLLTTDEKSGDMVTCYVSSKYLTLTEIPCQNHDSLIKPQFYYCGETIGDITFVETEPEVRSDYTPNPIADKYGDKYNKNSLLDNAAQFKGTPYVYGGASPSGFDCSGLVYFSMSLMGKSIARSAADQFNAGYAVDRDELHAGDLVFFGSDDNVSHVGIYAGGGKFLHAPNSGEEVSYSSLKGYWSENYVGARRVS